MASNDEDSDATCTNFCCNIKNEIEQTIEMPKFKWKTWFEKCGCCETKNTELNPSN